MPTFARLIPLVAFAFGLASQTRADTPPAEELLPSPTEVITYADAPAFPGYFRTTQYAVWQNYGVNRFGMFRPLVIHSPDGAYYRANGQPYPWPARYSLDFMPYASD